MSTIYQPPVPIELDTSLGRGIVLLVHDIGADAHILWTVALRDTGAIVTFRGPDVRYASSLTWGVASSRAAAAVAAARPPGEAAGGLGAPAATPLAGSLGGAFQPPLEGCGRGANAPPAATLPPTPAPLVLSLLEQGNQS